MDTKALPLPLELNGRRNSFKVQKSYRLFLMAGPLPPPPPIFMARSLKKIVCGFPYYTK